MGDRKADFEHERIGLLESLEDARNFASKAEGERELIAVVLREKEAQLLEKGVLLEKLKKDMEGKDWEN